PPTLHTPVPTCPTSPPLHAALPIYPNTDQPGTEPDNPDTNQPDAEPGTSTKNPDTNQSGTSSKEPQTSDEESSKAISGKKAENTHNGENSTSADKDSVATGDKTNNVSSVHVFSLSLD